MNTKGLILILLFLTFLFSGCSSFMKGMEKIADPYAKKFACDAPDGFKCLDLAETYAKDKQIDRTGYHAGGLTIGTGAVEPTAIDGNSMSGVGEEYDPNMVKTMIQIVLNAGSPDYAARELAVYIRNSESFPQMTAEMLQAKADSYVECIESAEGKNEKMRKRAKKGNIEFDQADAFGNLYQCTSHIFDVPGMTKYRSESISQELKIQREMTLRKGMTRKMTTNGMPIRIPAKVVRIMVTAYEDSGGLFNGPHHIYTTVGKPRWVLSTPKANGQRNGIVFDALE